MAKGSEEMPTSSMAAASMHPTMMGTQGRFPVITP